MSEDELDGLLGELQRDVMRVAWSRGTVSVRDVYEELAASRPLAYNTVLTVMTRLADKGILEREHRGQAHFYRAAQRGQRGFLREHVRRSIRDLLERHGDLAVAEFVDELCAGDAEKLASLEARLAKRRGEEEDT